MTGGERIPLIDSHTHCGTEQEVGVLTGVMDELKLKACMVCAICYGPSILANAGVLKGVKATCFQNQSGNLESHGAKYSGEAVERDGKFITASGPKAAKEFAKVIIRALSEYVWDALE